LILLGAGVALFLRSRPAPKTTSAPPSLAIAPFPSIAAPPKPAVLQATIAPSVIPAASPAATSASPEELTRASLADAEKYEAARDWPRAVMAYVDLEKKFPQRDVGRVRLELLLSKLLGDKKAWAEASEDQMRDPLMAAAKLGSSSAMELLGEFLRKRDPKASFDWLCAAAAQGRAHAMSEIGLRYSNGAGVERDFVKAAQWFEQARSAGEVSAGTLLAECYLYGKGVSKNEGKAVSLLQDAAAANDPRAMDQLATCYHKGIGAAPNDKEAFKLYTKAAQMNYLDSLGNLGVLYLTSDQTDLGRDQAARTQKALNLFREGAKQNNAFCMYLYARCYELGTGVDANATEAKDWYRRAAEAGNRPAEEWCRQHNVALGNGSTP
jgi:TPR repeat protein